MAQLTGRIRHRKHIPKESLQTFCQPSTSHADILFARVANLSQLGLLLLAVFGYFYTVVPVYQKSLLDEEIAKKTLALNSMETELFAKDTVLREKNETLSKLNVAVEKANQKLDRSKLEVGELRGEVQTQYSELRPRLVREFQSLVSSTCKLTIVPDGGLSDCVHTKVLPSANLLALSEADRLRLGNLIMQENAKIHTSWREYISSVEQRKADAQQRRNEAVAKCEQQRASSDYTDRMKKISIDYQCNVGTIQTQSDFLKIESKMLFSDGKVLSPALSEIVKKFYLLDGVR